MLKTPLALLAPMRMALPGARPAPPPARGLILAEREGAGIAAEDWNLLFEAVLDRLAQVAVERVAVDDAAVQGRALQPAGTRLRECLAALDQLRRSAPRRSGR